MDHHGMDDAGMDPHGTDLPGAEHDGVQHDGMRHDGLRDDGLRDDGLRDDGMRHDAGPEPGLDDLAGTDGGWHDLGYGDHLDPDLAGAQTADLSFAEDYHAGDLHAADLHDGAGVEEPLFGADPDLPPQADTGLGEDHLFPPTLDLDPPEPIDGYPWADPAVLGHDLLPPIEEAGDGPHPAELFEYAGEQPPADGDGWDALIASPDPATSALARWWSAG